MAREISRAEAYERAHQIFTQVNFNAFDYSSIKESLLDYVKLYYPEDFNDYIESSEFIALLEIFAYVSELLAYRIDVNAHENFITTALRKESILRLAKLISYKSSRNLPARGLVKITSIQTTEAITDSRGRNLSGNQIFWNDSNNVDWKEQFLLVMDRVLEQEFGSVAPNERVQVDDVLFELYSWNNNPLNVDGRGVFTYSASVSGTAYPMELVSSSLDDYGPREKRPERNASFSLLYANDGLGDGSDTTGFMLFTKQGQLRIQQSTFDGITPNQTLDLAIDNINETDIFINNVDADTREVLTVNPVAKLLPHLVSDDLRFGEWVSVDLSNAQNILFNTSASRHKFEVETLDNDQVRLVFGDGEFSDIPSGAFDIWYRTSSNTSTAIPKSAIENQSASFNYVDQSGNVQTLTFTFSLISSLQNGAASEDIEHVRKVAPSVYYTQDRMVNGRDYNTFMLQDPSIIKLRAINRTFAGDSKYIAWHDPSEYYENVKIFGDDAAIYWKEHIPSAGALHTITTPETPESMVFNVIEPLLCSSDFFTSLAPKFEALNLEPGSIRCTLNATIKYSFNNALTEKDAILDALEAATTTTPIVDLYYSVVNDEWTVGPHPDDPTADSIWMIRIEAQFAGSSLSGWIVRWRTRRLIINSEKTKFFNPNLSSTVIDFDSLDTVIDEIVILQANTNAERTGLLADNKHYAVVGQEVVDQNQPGAGLPDIHRLSALPADISEDNVPDDLTQGELLDATYEYTIQAGDISAGVATITIPEERFYVLGQEDVDITVYLRDILDTDTPLVFDISATGATNWNHSVTESGAVRYKIQIPSMAAPAANDIVRIDIKDHVYFTRESLIDPWKPQLPTAEVVTAWEADSTTSVDKQKNKRHEGRYPLNFGWFHATPRYHLIDPSATNIIDAFIVTDGYHSELVRYLENKTTVKPDEPTSLSLRTTYANLLNNKMISDTVILHPGKFKILFGRRAEPALRGVFKVVRPAQTTLTDNEIKVRIVSTIRTFFNIDDWEFGETFFFTELAASIHSVVGTEIDSVVVVPTFSQNLFGDLFQIQTREDEIFIPDINTSDIQIVQSYTSENIRQIEEST